MEIKEILNKLESKRLDIKKSEDSIKNLITILGEEKQLKEVLDILKQCTLEKENEKLEKYYNLRDHLLVKLIDDLIKFKLINKEDYTLNVLGKLNLDELNDLMIKYEAELRIATKYWKWKNVGTLFSYDKEALTELIENYGQDYKRFYNNCDIDPDDDDSDIKRELSSEEIAKDSLNTEILYKFIKDAIKKWKNTNIDDIKNELKNIKLKNLPSLDDIEFEWHYCTRIDDYDNYDSGGNFCDILEKIYRAEEDETGVSVELLYKRAKSPKDRNGWEQEYSNVGRTTDLPPIEIFLLLIWADVERCQNIK